MKMFDTFGLAISASAVVAILGLGSAEAGTSWAGTDKCHAPMVGVATSKGILGLGSANARVAVRHNWENSVARRYGTTFSNLDRARDVRWDCKKGAILLAKCVVTAKPYGPGIRN